MTGEDSFQLLMRPGVDPRTAPNKPPLPPLVYDERIEQGVLIQRNLAVPLRDGVRIYVDLYRPPGVESGLPVLLGWSPYGKHGLSNRVFWPASGVDPQWLSPLTAFEAPDPVFWCQRGYAVVFADPRGAWQSEGEFHHNGIVEARGLPGHDRVARRAVLVQRPGGHDGRVVSGRDPVLRRRLAACRARGDQSVGGVRRLVSGVCHRMAAYPRRDSSRALPTTSASPLPAPKIPGRTCRRIRSGMRTGNRKRSSWRPFKRRPTSWRAGRTRVCTHAARWRCSSASPAAEVARRSWTEEVGTLLPRGESASAGRVFRSFSPATGHSGDRLAAGAAGDPRARGSLQRSGPRMSGPWHARSIESCGWMPALPH